MDFIHDQLADGRCFRAFVVVDDFSRESVTITVGTSLTSADIAVALEQVIGARGCPTRIVCDNGPEFRAKHFVRWASSKGIELPFIEPGKPIQNAFAESFNGRFRDECLNAHVFGNLAEARRLIARWRDHYNNRRPHSGIGNISPNSYRRRAALAA